jgi:hypothetical protein
MKSSCCRKNSVQHQVMQRFFKWFRIH